MKFNTKSLQVLLLIIGIYIWKGGFSQVHIERPIPKNSLKSIEPTCGSYSFLEILNKKSPGFLDLSNELVKNTLKKGKQNSSNKIDIYKIPVVFHIVYNTDDENLPDSVITNQLEILNQAFRRQNADTINLRNEFSTIVGDAKIEFELASFDPYGVPSTGITRTQTNVEYFGGILPYNANQSTAISNWVNDSLYYNFFRLSNSSLGGINPWNENKYLNIWIGDLRIYEPYIGNSEELVFFAIATPPLNQANWPQETIDIISPFSQGVLIHYVNVGSNNSNLLPPPYSEYNNKTKSGKVLVHETGHYLGLRHIWGDGNCSMDDYIDDTPNSIAASNFDCDLSKNTCNDNINGVDLPDMIENYMDYSNGNCQNSFTLKQIVLMHNVIHTFRPELITQNYGQSGPITTNVYPNPFVNEINIKLEENFDNVDLFIRDLNGKLIYVNSHSGDNEFVMKPNLKCGIYFLYIDYGTHKERVKLLKI